MDLVDSLQTTTGVLELQQGGEKLVKKLKDIQDAKWKSIQSKIDMLKQESLEAQGKVRVHQASVLLHIYVICGSFVIRKRQQNRR